MLKHVTNFYRDEEGDRRARVGRRDRRADRHGQLAERDVYRGFHGVGHCRHTGAGAVSDQRHKTQGDGSAQRSR